MSRRTAPLTAFEDHAPRKHVHSLSKVRPDAGGDGGGSARRPGLCALRALLERIQRTRASHGRAPRGGGDGRRGIAAGLRTRSRVRAGGFFARTGRAPARPARGHRRRRAGSHQRGADCGGCARIQFCDDRRQRRVRHATPGPRVDGGDRNLQGDARGEPAARAGARGTAHAAGLARTAAAPGGRIAARGFPGRCGRGACRTYPPPPDAA